MRFGILADSPIPAAPLAWLPACMREENVLRDIVDRGIKAIPAGVGRIQGQTLGRRLQRPPLEQKSRQTGLPGAAPAVDENDGRRSLKGQDVGP